MIKLPRKTTWKYSHEEKRYNWKHREESPEWREETRQKRAWKLSNATFEAAFSKQTQRLSNKRGRALKKQAEKLLCIYKEKKRETMGSRTLTRD